MKAVSGAEVTDQPVLAVGAGTGIRRRRFSGALASEPTSLTGADSSLTVASAHRVFFFATQGESPVTSNNLFRHAVRGLAVLSCAMVLTGCLTAKSYVDPALPVVSRANIAAPATPHPVQVAFEFRTKGSANAAATAELQPRAVAVAAESGLFSAVSRDAAGPGAGLLTVVIDNVPLEGENAAAEGFGTGLTFGAVGTMVTDAYVGTVTYSRGGQTTSVNLRHALHTTIGNKAGPEGLTGMTPVEAVHQVIDQIIWNGLDQLADRRAFE